MKKHLSLLVASIALLRPKQWIKNFFLFFPAIFSGTLLDAGILPDLILLFFLFSLFSGATYIWNDIIDREKDRQHPKKKHRPLASGIMPLPIAVIEMCSIFVGTIGGLWYAFPSILPLFLLYGAYTFLYSLFFKHVVLLDIFSLSIGFLIRIWIGALAVSVAPSFWLVLIVFFVSVWFGASKRYQEVLLGTSSRKVLASYSRDFLRTLLALLTGLLIVLYTMYVHEEHIQGLMLYTIPLFAFGIIRYLYVVEHEEDRSRSIEDILMSDLSILCSLLLYGVLTVYSIFFH